MNDRVRVIAETIQLIGVGDLGLLAEQIDRRLADLPARAVYVPEHIMQFFAYEHLPQYLQEVSKPFAGLAMLIVGSPDTEALLPRNPERTTALRKLLEAKDAAVRARLAK